MLMITVTYLNKLSRVDILRLWIGPSDLTILLMLNIDSLKDKDSGKLEESKSICQIIQILVFQLKYNLPCLLQNRKRAITATSETEIYNDS